MIAIDTNIFVYRFDRQEPTKQSVAKQLISQLAKGGETLLLWQVAGELLNQLTYWQHRKLIERPEVEKIIHEIRNLFSLVMPTPACLDQALALSSRYSLQHWDSMLLGACLEAGITTLYTEDMGSPRKIATIELVNPF